MPPERATPDGEEGRLYEDEEDDDEDEDETSVLSFPALALALALALLLLVVAAGIVPAAHRRRGPSLTSQNVVKAAIESN